MNASDHRGQTTDLLNEIALLRERSDQLQQEARQGRKVEQALRRMLAERDENVATLRQSLEKERETRDAAERRDATKDEILGIVGHDLRNPLSAILNYARLEAMREDLPELSATGLSRIIASGMRMQRMIEQLLDRARDDFHGGIPVALVEQPIVPILMKVVDETRAARPDRRIEVSFAAELVDGGIGLLVAVDADRIEQVMSNLLDNAISHGASTAPVRVSVRCQGGRVVIEVQNEGPVLDPAVVPSLFDPFKRTCDPCRRSAGLGLGLYIADRIVRAHGGNLTVRSSAESGTIFGVELWRSNA